MTANIKSSSAKRLMSAEKVVLFDGVCKFCHTMTRFLIKYDKCQQFKLCTLQSKKGQALLTDARLPDSYLASVLLIDDGGVYAKSEALIRICVQLGGVWRVAIVLKSIPKSWRDWCYDKFGQNRYRWFGQYDTCVIPTDEVKDRFLE